MEDKQIPPKATGKLGVLLIGLGAVSTTLVAGVEAVKQGHSRPIGSLTQMGRIRLGKRTKELTGERNPYIKDFVPLAALEDIVFGAWDIFPDNALEAAQNAKVLQQDLLMQVSEQLQSLKPMAAVFDPNYVQRLNGTHIKSADNKMQLAEAVMEDIAKFKADHGCDRLVMIWCASTEKYIQPSEHHETIASLEQAMLANEPDIAPSMIYAYAALQSRVPFINGAPNLTVDTPALVALAERQHLPIAGKDFKTGQTLMKTILAPGLKARMLGIDGWYSTNILGNRDGEVLDHPDNFKSKEESKLGGLEGILHPDLNPELYGDLCHVVRINYYPPRGDNKEGWDNIDIFGWLDYKMQIKIDFLCKDSILAAPVALDLVLFTDLAQRAITAGVIHAGVQEWLSFYFKAPQSMPNLYPIHDLFEQLNKLENTLRHMMNEELITNLGHDYYSDRIKAAEA